MARLLLLGPARDAAGLRHDEVDGPTLDVALARAVERYGEEFARVLAISHVWVNGEAARADAPVTETDEIAVLPPVSGG